MPYDNPRKQRLYEHYKQLGKSKRTKLSRKKRKKAYSRYKNPGTQKQIRGLRRAGVRPSKMKRMMD